MRRGLLAWSEEETPKAALEARVQRLQVGMTAAGYDALLAYTNFPRPAAVSYLTHFIPYWNQGLLVVPGTGLPTLLVALSNRVRGWALETCHVADVVCTPRIGAEAAKVVQGVAGAKPKVGVVDGPRLPQGIAGPFADAFGGIPLNDATALYAAARNPADGPELALSRRAAEIADQALAEVDPQTMPSAGAAIAAVEGAARLAAAEEVQIALAPDLSADTAFRRFEGDAPLGGRFAVRATVAYKGFWVRRIRTFARTGANGLDETIRDAVGTLGDGSGLSRALTSALGDDLAAWQVEGAYGGAPLADLDGSAGTVRGAAPGSIVTLGVRLETPDGPWLGGGAVHLAEKGGTGAAPLFAPAENR